MKITSTRGLRSWQLSAAFGLQLSLLPVRVIQPKCNRRLFTPMLMMGLMLMALWISSVNREYAVLPVGPSTQFDITGFLQEATLTTPGNTLSGGTLKVNGHVVTVPANTIVIYPANAVIF